MFLLPTQTEFLLYQLSWYKERIMNAKTKKELNFLMARVEEMTESLTDLIK